MEKNNKYDIVPLNLKSPPASQTDTSIALIWDKPSDSLEIVCYHVFVNGTIHGISTSTDYTISSLESSKEYEAYVCSVSMNGIVSPSSLTIKISTKPKAEIFDITAFGAVADNLTINTKAIQAAIDACAPGGKVYVPKGTFVTGAIFLKSNMTLYVEKEGVLLGSDNPSDYPVMTYRWEGREQLCYASLVNTKDCQESRLENITIDGEGKIDANGSALFINEMREMKGYRGRAVCLRNVDHVYMKDITVRQSPAWCVHLIYCNHISVNNIEIHTKNDEYGKRYEHIFNGDGLNPDSSSDVYIFNSMIASQDDCIAIKSGRDEEGRRVGIPSENIRITNCSFKCGFGIAMGSEMAGGVRNVLIKDCTFENSFSIATVKAPRGRGARIDNIRYEDCKLINYDLDHEDCKWFRGAINIDQFYSHDEYDPDLKEEVNEGTPVIQNIFFKNIVLDTYGGNAIFLAGLPESPLQNIYLENVTAIGKYGLKAYNVQGFVMKNVLVNSRNDEAYMFHSAELTKE
ncbi:glycoside hydrolase family 28 protein [Paenibacillus sp. LMG 31461]|uniref:Glycoside hydrolase family 28 protein n=1 Tax=Paenibacillus plantarum TaxID=2654975 RepID=A0ABX1X381_9BACL|nr:glycoside hydrolase family 28 protein [Paenibacillus plantarum]NOU62862.1 glycoside hydrolase family 28 protein [Paenibacillus plantarum]